MLFSTSTFHTLLAYTRPGWPQFPFKGPSTPAALVASPPTSNVTAQPLAFVLTPTSQVTAAVFS